MSVPLKYFNSFCTSQRILTPLYANWRTYAYITITYTCARILNNTCSQAILRWSFLAWISFDLAYVAFLLRLFQHLYVQHYFRFSKPCINKCTSFTLELYNNWYTNNAWTCLMDSVFSDKIRLSVYISDCIKDN